MAKSKGNNACIDEQVQQIKVGGWVQCKNTLAYGLVNAIGNLVSVQWAGGETSKENKESLEWCTPQDYYEAIKSYAITELKLSETDLFALHGPIANGRDKMTLAVLSELEEKLLSMSSVEIDNEYEDVAAAFFEQTEEDDIFSQYGIDDEAPKSASPAEGCQGSGAGGAANASSTTQAVTDPFQPKQQVSTEAEATTATDNTTSSASSVETTQQQPSESAPSAVQTDAGLIDPETGELIEQSFILRKLGWTEWPTLSKKPTKEELDAFEQKLDQVAEKIFNHTDKTDRWRAANEERCAPYDKAAEFWTKQFLEPLARQIAPFRLPKKKKTLKLAAGSIKFTKTGGAYVADNELLKSHIKEQGVENFVEIKARETISYDYPTLIKLLNKGTLKGLPGTGTKADDPYGKVTLVSPKVSQEKDQGESAEDPEGGANCPITCPDACPNHLQLKIQGEKNV